MFTDEATECEYEDYPRRRRNCPGRGCSLCMSSRRKLGQPSVPRSFGACSNTRVTCRPRVSAVTEALIDLAEHTDWDVGEVQVTPVQFSLHCVASRSPTTQNCVEMIKDPLSSQAFRAPKESQILRLTGIPVIGGNRLVNEGQEVPVECRVEPGRGLRCLVCRGERIFQFAGSRANLITLGFPERFADRQGSGRTALDPPSTGPRAHPVFPYCSQARTPSSCGLAGRRSF